MHLLILHSLWVPRLKFSLILNPKSCVLNLEKKKDIEHFNFTSIVGEEDRLQETEKQKRFQ